MRALRGTPPVAIAPPDPARTRADAPRFSILVPLAVGRMWRERARYRSVLSQTGPHDFADPAPPSAVTAAETRRRPWQKPSGPRQEIAALRRARR